MVVGDNESTATINAGKSLAILIAMAMKLDRAHPGLHWKPLDITIGRLPVPHHPIGHHG
jgi:hypothetical protein